jgi:hypothetical protein
VFISSFHNDRAEVNAFIYQWATLQKVFTPKALCTFDNDDFINSDNPEYVMSEIRRKYVGDASVSGVRGVNNESYGSDYRMADPSCEAASKLELSKPAELLRSLSHDAYDGGNT